MNFSFLIFLFAASQVSYGFLVWFPRPPRHEESSAAANANYSNGENLHQDINFALEQEAVNIQKSINETIRDVFQIFAKYKKGSVARDGGNDFGVQLKDAIVGLVLDQLLRERRLNETNGDIDATKLQDQDNEDAIALNELSEMVSMSADGGDISSNSTRHENVTVIAADGMAINISQTANETRNSTSPFPSLFQRAEWFTVRINANITAVDRYDSNNTINATDIDDSIRTSEEIVDHVTRRQNNNPESDSDAAPSSFTFENITEVDADVTAVGGGTLAEASEKEGSLKIVNFDDKWKFARESAMDEASEERVGINAVEDEGKEGYPEERERMIVRAHRYDTL